MAKRILVPLLPFLLCLVLLGSPSARAEWMADIYLGVSHTDAGGGDFVIGGSVVRPLENSDVSTPFGARLGYWFERSEWLGVALDVSAYFPKFDDGGPPQPVGNPVISQVPMSLLVMVRHPLMRDDAFPKGRLQPYLGAGPSLVFGGISEFAGASVAPPAVLEDTSWSLGLDLRAGLTWMISPRVGAFVEYRYLQNKPSFESATGGGKVTYEPKLKTNAAVLGVSFRF